MLRERIELGQHSYNYLNMLSYFLPLTGFVYHLRVLQTRGIAEGKGPPGAAWLCEFGLPNGLSASDAVMPRRDSPDLRARRQPSGL